MVSQTIILTTDINETASWSLTDNGTIPKMISRRFGINSGIFSHEDFDMVRDLRSKLGLPLAFIGCLLNILAVIVYSRMAASFVNKYLIGLQILDSLFLICMIYPFFLLVVHGPSAGHTKVYNHYAKYINNYLYTCFQRANIFCTAVLSINRCIVMLAPFNQFVKKIFKYPAHIITTTQIITFISSLYIIFKTRVGKVKISDGSERYMLIPTEAYNENSEIFDSLGLCNTFIFTYIPAVGTFIANICMVIGLIIMSRRKAKGDDPENKKFFKMGHQKTTVVLVYSSFSLVLLIPFMIHPVLKLTIPGYGAMKKEHYMFISMGSIVALCDIIRSAMGFFVFLGLSRIFRETFIALILRKDVSDKVQNVTKTTKTRRSALPPQ